MVETKEQRQKQWALGKFQNFRNGWGYSLHEMIRKGVGSDDFQHVLAGHKNTEIRVEQDHTCNVVRDSDKLPAVKPRKQYKILEELDNKHGTPSVHAIKKKNLRRASFLLEHGANPNGMNEDGFPQSLWEAIQATDAPMVKLLLEHGVDPNKLVNIDGHTPLLQAAAQDKQAIVEILLKYGARPDAKVKALGGVRNENAGKGLSEINGGATLKKLGKDLDELNFDCEVILNYNQLKLDERGRGRISLEVLDTISAILLKKEPMFMFGAKSKEYKKVLAIFTKAIESAEKDPLKLEAIMMAAWQIFENHFDQTDIDAISRAAQSRRVFSRVEVVPVVAESAVVAAAAVPAQRDVANPASGKEAAPLAASPKPVIAAAPVISVKPRVVPAKQPVLVGEEKLLEQDMRSKADEENRIAFLRTASEYSEMPFDFIEAFNAECKGGEELDMPVLAEKWSRLDSRKQNSFINKFLDAQHKEYSPSAPELTPEEYAALYAPSAPEVPSAEFTTYFKLQEIRYVPENYEAEQLPPAENPEWLSAHSLQHQLNPHYGRSSAPIPEEGSQKVEVDGEGEYEDFDDEPPLAQKAQVEPGVSPLQASLSESELLLAELAALPLARAYQGSFATVFNNSNRTSPNDQNERVRQVNLV